MACTTGPTTSSLAASTSAPARTTTGARCPATALSSGPITSQVVVITRSSASAAAGSVLPVTTEIVVLSDAPSVVAKAQWSALEVLDRSNVVARAVGVAGADVPTTLTRGTSVRATTVPASITLTGCDGRALAPGSYHLRALVGYRSGSDAAYAMVSEPDDLTIT